MRYWKGSIGFGLFLVVILISAWAVTDASAQAPKEVVIGYTGPISGVAAEYGQDVGNGIEMAINDINGGGGIMVKGQKYNFKLVKLDEGLDPTASVNNCRRLRESARPGWPAHRCRRGCRLGARERRRSCRPAPPRSPRRAFRGG